MASFGGILAGTDPIIDKHLSGAPDKNRSYRHKREALGLRQTPSQLDAAEMLRLLVKQIRDNLGNRDSLSIGNSSENWREEKEPNHSENNTSNETRLERKLVQALTRADRVDWWNQMPIASGLVGVHADRRRAIDLVHRCDGEENRYELVELKVDSDTPLFALMEIVLYGLVYLVLRKERDWLPEISRTAKMFDARSVGLRVLAPKEYYARYKLRWLEEALNRALPGIIAERQLGASFAMEVSSHWPIQLEQWDEAILKSDSRLLSCLREWEPAFPS